MENKTGTSLVYTVEGSSGFHKILKETIASFDKKFEYTPNEQLEILVWPTMIRWQSGDFRIDYHRDSDSLTIKGDQHIKSYTIDSFSREIDQFNGEHLITPLSIPTHKHAKLNTQRISLAHHRIDFNGDTLDLWSTSSLDISPSSTKLIWALWFKGLLSQMPSGIPYQFDYRNADHPEKIWMKLKLKAVTPLTHKPPRPKIAKAPLRREPAMHAIIEKPQPEFHVHQKIESFNWSKWWQANATSGKGTRKIGVAYEQPALDQVAAALNHVISRLGPFSGGYNFTDNELVIDWNIWGRLSPLLNGTTESLNALQQSVVAAHLLGGGEPVMHWQREGGLTAMEYTRLQLLRQIMETFAFTDGRWSADSEAYLNIDVNNILIPMDERHQTPECTGSVQKDFIFLEALEVLNQIQELVDNQGIDLHSEIIKTIVHLYMVGFSDFADFGEIVFITAFVDPTRLEYTALGTWSVPPQVATTPNIHSPCRRTINQSAFTPGFDRRRAQAFINAQMEELLGIRARIPKQDLQKSQHIANGSLAYAGPIYYFNVQPASVALANLRHVNPVEHRNPFSDESATWRRQLRANLQLTSAEVELSLGLHISESTRWLIILGSSLIIPLVGLAIVPDFARGSASVSLRDIDIPITLNFVPSGEGYDVAIHNALDDNGQPSATIGTDLSDYRFPWPVDAIVGMFRHEFTNFMRIILSHIFGTNEFDGLAITRDAKIPLPWPDMLNMRGGPALTRFEPQHDQAHLAVWRALWALPPDTGVGSPVPLHVDLQDVDSLGYLFTASGLSAWLLATLRIPGMRELDHADAFLGLRGVQLPALSQYTEPERLIQDRTNRNLQASRFITFCGEPPAVSAPTRSYRMQFTIHAPRVDLQEGEHDNAIGEFVFTCHLRIDAIQTEEYVVSEIANSGSAAIPIDGVIANMGAYTNRQTEGDVRTGFPNDPTTGLSDEGAEVIVNTAPEEVTYPESGALAPDEPFGKTKPSCRWKIQQEDYVLSTIVDGTFDVTGQLQLGFSSSAPTSDLGAIDPKIILPQIAIAPVRDAQRNVALQMTAHLDLADDLSSEQQSTLRAEIEAMCRQEIIWIINSSRQFGHSHLSGSRQVLPLPSQIINALPAPIRQARWIQQGSELNGDEAWDLEQHIFHYVVRNGHAIWPIELQLNIPALLS